MPNLRFPEFEGEWEYVSLQELAPNISSGKDKPTNGEVTLYGSTGRMGKTDKVTYNEEIILVARVGANAGTIQIVNEPCGVTDNALVLNAHTWNHYIYYYLQQYNLNRLVFGSGQPLITGGMLKKIKIGFGCEAERDKIYKTLMLIDERISTQNRIIDKLQSLMKGLNNYLMDNSSWENVRVGDFMDFYSTNSLSWEQLDYKQGKIKNLHYGLIHSGLPTLIDCCLCTLPNIKDEFLLKQHTLCEDGDVAFADASEDTNEVGKAVEFYNCKEQSVVCGLHTIHGRDKANLTIVGFKGFAFNAKYFHDQLRRISQGSKIYSISTENVKSCYLRIPSKSEQRQVARLLSTFLQKINIAEQELKAYQEQKKYLLKAMFV